MANRKTGPLARPPAIGRDLHFRACWVRLRAEEEDHGSRAYVQCRCECGTVEREVKLVKSSCDRGAAARCGCLVLQAISVRKSVVGECYGHVTVIAEAEDRSRPSGAYTRSRPGAMWLRERVFETSLFHLQRGHTTSCGHPSHRMILTACMTHPHTER